MYDVLYCEMQMRGQFFSKFYTTYFKPKWWWCDFLCL